MAPFLHYRLHAFLSWFTKAVTRRSGRARSCRMSCDLLESRLVPASLTITDAPEFRVDVFGPETLTVSVSVDSGKVLVTAAQPGETPTMFRSNTPANALTSLTVDASTDSGQTTLDLSGVTQAAFPGLNVDISQMANAQALAGISIVAGTSRNTITGSRDLRNSIFSSAGTDTILGGNAGDRIFGSTGSDSIVGGTGADTIFGGGGADTIFGGGGNDLIFGGHGSSMLFAFAPGKQTVPGDVTIVGGSGNDTIQGGVGMDLLIGGNGNDLILSGSQAGGQNDLYAVTGNDTLVAGAGNDLLVGSTGTSILRAGTGTAVLAAGSGSTTFDLSKATQLNLVLTNSTAPNQFLGGVLGKNYMMLPDPPQFATASGIDVSTILNSFNSNVPTNPATVARIIRKTAKLAYLDAHARSLLHGEASSATHHHGHPRHG